ncbi:MAG: hypothetical protein ACTHMS_22615 [Jatrophihabitans sp.]|uniref:hypothetical protein n=1 Tax=Jatrophihabitans sp. TaxID=1932789 RepID=UPI003F7F9BAB
MLRSTGTSADDVDDAVLRDAVAVLRALADGPAPEPSPQVAALLEGGAAVVPLRRRPRPVRSVGLAAAAIVALTTGLAATHTLPTPAQRFVSDVVDRLTPFDIAPPHPSPHVTTTPDGRPSSPASTPPPTASPTSPVAPSTSSQPPPPRSPDDGGSGRQDVGGGDGGTGAATTPQPGEPGDDGGTSRGGTPAPTTRATHPSGDDGGGGGTDDGGRDD